MDQAEQAQGMQAMQMQMQAQFMEMQRQMQAQQAEMQRQMQMQAQAMQEQFMAMQRATAVQGAPCESDGNMGTGYDTFNDVVHSLAPDDDEDLGDDEDEW